MNLLKNYGFDDYFVKDASLYPIFQIARVISQYKGIYKIVNNHSILNAKISGKFLNKTTKKIDFPIVGDFVLISTELDSAIIHKVLKRKTLLKKALSENSTESKGIVANLDYVFITMSLNNNFNLNRLERYLSIVFQSGATAIILLTKSDLEEDIESKILQVELVAGFSQIICVSIYDNNFEEKILKCIKAGQTAAFIGSSGVGKSTIINKLLHKNMLNTKETGKKDKGKHTTTNSNMFILSNNSIVIDTPGMRELSLDNDDLSTSFKDIENLSLECKFSNCTHTNEAGCAILRALDEGVLDIRHYNNYLKLKREKNYQNLSNKEIEKEKHQRMFKEIGGIKNYKKYVKNSSKRK